MNTITVNDNKIKQFFYQTQCSILFPKKKVDLFLNNIGSIGCDYNFNQNKFIFPIMHLKIYLDHLSARELRENFDNISFYIKVYSYSRFFSNEVDNIKLPSNNVSLSNSDLIFEGNFKPYNNDTNYYQDNNKATGGMLTKTEDSEDNNDTEEIELFLFNSDCIKQNNTIINAILERCFIKDVLGYILTETNIKSALISTPDNIHYYNEEEDIILPSSNVKKSLYSLQNVYGIYQKGFTMFFDFNMFYLLDNDLTKTTPQLLNDYELVYIRICNNEEVVSIKEGCYTDRKNGCYIISSVDTAEISDDERLNGAVYGNNFSIMNKTKIKDSVEYNEKTGKFEFSNSYNNYDISSKTDNSKNIILFDNNDNIFNESTLIEDLNNSVQITMSFSNIDLRILKPNKKFVFQFAEVTKQKYNGIYKIMSTTYSFDNNDFLAVGIFRRFSKF